MAGLLMAGLVWRLAHPVDTTLHSRLVGHSVPAFALPASLPGKPALQSVDFQKGEPQLLNIFASWCVPCIAEAPILAQMHRQGVRIVGVAIRDKSEDVAVFLKRHGDPYERIGSDRSSRVQLALGSSGVPESFVIDGRGIIRYHHIGPIQAGDAGRIMAEMEKVR
jgi:cytochrome c biogenesis protein CcmG/thiol:disulfide interchange protein DsbE